VKWPGAPRYRAYRREGLYYAGEYRKNEGAMPRRSKGPRLLLRKERRGKSGRVVQNATWIILDTINGRHEKSTSCGVNDRQGAERALADYLSHKYLTEVSRDERDPAHIPIADVLTLYTRDIAPKHTRPGPKTGVVQRTNFENKKLEYRNPARDSWHSNTPSVGRCPVKAPGSSRAHYGLKVGSKSVLLTVHCAMQEKPPGRS
jgi:hypothetical protein